MVEEAGAITEAAAFLDRLEGDHGAPYLRILVNIETPKGLRRRPSSPRRTGVSAGCRLAMQTC